jgi:hypothetical protein
MADPVVGSQYLLDPSAGNSIPVRVYYDGSTVRLWDSDEDLLSAGLSEWRFFAINFFDELGSGNFSSRWNATSVAQISILNKGDEVAQVVRAIERLTHVTDIIVIAHSQGGLNTRAYMEGQAVPFLVVS